MNTQGKVNKRLFKKTELATHKVELALINDLEVHVSKAEKYDKESKKLFDSLVSEIENKTRSLGNLSNSGQAALDTYLKIGKQIKAATKELGIDLPPEVAALTKKIQKHTSAINIRASIGRSVRKASK